MARRHSRRAIVVNRVKARHVLQKHSDLSVTCCAERSLAEDVQGAIAVMSGTSGDEVHALIHDHNSRWSTITKERVASGAGCVALIGIAQSIAVSGRV